MVQLTAVSEPPLAWMPAPTYWAELPAMVLLVTVSDPESSSMPPPVPNESETETELSETVLSVIVIIGTGACEDAAASSPRPSCPTGCCR